MEGYLLDIAITPHGHSTKNILDDLEAGIKGVQKLVELAVKVLGENRYVIVVSNDNVEEVTEMVNTCGTYLTITSTPISDYETFSRGFVGVEDSMLPERKTPAKIDPSKELFMIHVNVEYVGKSLEEFFDIVKQEGVAILSMIYGGQVPLSVYKVLASRKVVLFIQLDAPSLDRMIFGLPAVKLMGDQVHGVAKGLKVVAMK